MEAQEMQTPEGSRTWSDGRDIVEGIYKFKRDTIRIMERIPSYLLDKNHQNGDIIDSNFVAIKKLTPNTDLDLNINDIKIIAAYSYDIPKFGTGLDPWIDLNIEPMELPAEIDWLSAEINTVDGEIGLTVSESVNAPEWTNFTEGERAIKIDLAIGINETQYTTCSLIVLQLRSVDGFPQPLDATRFFYLFSPGDKAEISPDGEDGAFTVSYDPMYYSSFTSEGFILPENVEIDPGFSEKIGDPVQEAIDHGKSGWHPYDGWTILDVDKIKNSEGVYDLGWAKIKIVGTPDGSKRIEYSISKNTTGKTRQIRISDGDIFPGKEYALGRFSCLPIYWDIYIQQDK